MERKKEKDLARVDYIKNITKKMRVVNNLDKILPPLVSLTERKDSCKKKLNREEELERKIKVLEEGRKICFNDFKDKVRILKAIEKEEAILNKSSKVDLEAYLKENDDDYIYFY